MSETETKWLEKVKAVKRIIVHDNCPDGMASAILLKDAFYPNNIPIEFVQYGTKAFEALQPEPGTLYADFSPPIKTKKNLETGAYYIDPDPANLEKLQAFVNAGVLILDHHETAKPIVEAFGENGIFGSNSDSESGATLSYKNVWAPLRGNLVIQDQFAREFSRIAGIRDTWQRTHADWRTSCCQAQVLKFIPKERWLSKSLTEIASSWDSDYAWLGQMLQEKLEHTIKKISDKAYKFTTDRGTRVFVFEGVSKSSDVAEALHDTVDFVVAFNYEVEGDRKKMILSTRSHTFYDCAAFAANHGGGGHVPAAGCNMTVLPYTLNPYALIEALVKSWEIHPSYKVRAT